MSLINKLEVSDPIISNLINKEKQRQQSHLELIASENFTSLAVMAVSYTHLTLPTKRIV